MVKKIQLNDEQWMTLQMLLEAHSRQRPIVAIRVSERLRSNGLVASDPKGCVFLTEQGRQRLSQGR